jgi:hypothetical protein
VAAAATASPVTRGCPPSWQACGERGTKALDAAAEFCCERSNPVLQVRQAGAACIKRPPLPPRFQPRLRQELAARARAPPPASQVVYVALVLGNYWLFWQHVFSLLPNPVVSVHHM